MKKYNLSGLWTGLLMVLIFCTGCPYESQYPLKGELIKHPENIVGKWMSDSVELVISINENDSLKVHYNDREDGNENSIDGFAYVIKHKKNKFIILKADGPGTYFIAKIIKANPEVLQLNILDDKILKKDKTFTSEDDFSSFVYSNDKEVFLPPNVTTFKKSPTQ